MGYTVLARRYRSNTFDEIVGQERVARTLRRAIETDRIAHAFLFCGTRGVGKTSMARILAKALNCNASEKPTPTPCGKCASCIAIRDGQDLDVIEIDAASNTQVEKVRELIENCRFRPARARFKVYIIDEVHMLSRGAFNALLKTLEEPPAHVKFILATTETEKVPATILSRCQRYDFRNIPTREIAAHLAQICRDEKVKADEDALFIIARAGAGSMRDALSVLERLLSLGETSLTLQHIEQMLGVPKAQAIFDLVQAIGRGDPRGALQTADTLLRDGLAPESLVGALAEHLHNLLILATCGKQSDLVDAPGISVDELAAQADQFDPVTLTQNVVILEDLRRTLRTASAGRALLDATLVRLALAREFTRIEDLLAGSDAASPPVQKKKPDVTAPSTGARHEGAGPPSHRHTEAREPVPPTPPARRHPHAINQNDPADDHPAVDQNDDALPAVGRPYNGPTRSLRTIMSEARAPIPQRLAPPRDALEPVARGEFDSVMRRLRDALKRHGPGFDGLLVNGQIVSLQDGQAVIRYRHEDQSIAVMLERNGKREKVQQALTELLDEPVAVRIEVEPPTPAPPSDPADLHTDPASNPPTRVAPPPRRSEPTAEPPASEIPSPATVLTAEQKQQILSSDELVRAACEMFNADIVRVER